MTSIEAPPASAAHPVSSPPRGRFVPLLVLAVLAVAALVVRWQFVDYESGDYRTFLSPWFAHLLQAGGFAGLADLSSNYNSPYLVLLAILTYLPVPNLISIKVLSMIFDLVLALFAYKIIRVVRPESRWLPTIAAGVTLFLPTVIMNSSVWAQCDSIYASCCLGSLYFLITRRPWRAALLLGLALAFKLQAVFFLPVLLGVLVVNRMRVRTLLAVPGVFLAALVPAWLAGRSLVTQLLTYPAQMGLSGAAAGSGTGGGRPAGGTSGGGRGGGAGTPPSGGGGGGFSPGAGAGGGGTGGGGTFPQGGGGGSVGTGHAFTYNAPTWYSWLPSDAGDVWKYVGLAISALVAVGFGIFLLRRGRRLTPPEILLLAATATLVIPLLLPEMHERYFYLAEVLTGLAIFVNRGFVAAAACIQLATVATYLAYFSDTSYVSLELVALVALTGAVVAAVTFVRHLRRTASTAPDDATPTAVGLPA